MNSTRAILLTGAASGIGRALVDELQNEKFEIIAVVRTSSDIEELAQYSHVSQTIVANLSNDSDLADLLSSVNRELYAIVNCAGSSQAGPLENINGKDILEVLQTNAIAPIKIIQGLIPHLESNGRVINISSGEAFFATPINGAYCASKRALEAMTDVLRLELHNKNVHVVSVVPSGTKTNMIQKKSEQHDGLLEQPENLGYIPMIRARQKITAQAAQGDSPSKVAEVIKTALLSKQPKARYFVGFAARLPYMLSILPLSWQLKFWVAQGIYQAEHQ